MIDGGRILKNFNQNVRNIAECELILDFFMVMMMMFLTSFFFLFLFELIFIYFLFFGFLLNL
jgi:hypothetical protein